MQVSFSAPAAVEAARLHAAAPGRAPSARGDEPELRRAFQSFVGETLFGQLLQAMRRTVGKPAYFHGGRAEEIFQQQLDQVLAEKISEASAETFSEPMFELFVMKRR
jgi:hypothetical protein